MNGIRKAFDWIRREQIVIKNCSTQGANCAPGLSFRRFTTQNRAIWRSLSHKRFVPLLRNRYSKGFCFVDLIDADMLANR